MIISAGSKLLFGKDVFIEIDGGTIQALGTDDKKILFHSISDKEYWNGLLVKIQEENLFLKM